MSCKKYNIVQYNRPVIDWLVTELCKTGMSVTIFLPCNRSNNKWLNQENNGQSTMNIIVSFSLSCQRGFAQVLCIDFLLYLLILGFASCSSN